MAQSKLASFIESVTSIAIGFCISLMVWVFVIKPLYGIETAFMQNLGITGIFTVFSVARAYTLRRVFTKKYIQRLITWLRRRQGNKVRL